MQAVRVTWIKYPSDEPLPCFTLLSVMMESPLEHKVSLNCSELAGLDGREDGWIDGWLGKKGMTCKNFPVWQAANKLRAPWGAFRQMALFMFYWHTRFYLSLSASLAHFLCRCHVEPALCAQNLGFEKREGCYITSINMKDNLRGLV